MCNDRPKQQSTDVQPSTKLDYTSVSVQGINFLCEQIVRNVTESFSQLKNSPHYKNRNVPLSSLKTFNFFHNT